jgi:hypothetical protein
VVPQPEPSKSLGNTRAGAGPFTALDTHSHDRGTARHAGHADLTRESIDGEVGDFRDP